MPTAQYCTADDVVTLFPSSAPTSEQQQLLAITLASSYVENYTQRTLAPATYTHEESPLIINRSNQIVGKVRQWPITSVTAASVLLLGSPNTPSRELPLDVTYIDFQSPPERLFYYSGSLPSSPTPGYVAQNFGGVRKGMRGRIYVTYTAGFTPVPDDIRTACILLAQHYLTLNANAVGALSISVSAPSSSNSISFGRRSVLLDEAEQLLNAYVRRE